MGHGHLVDYYMEYYRVWTIREVGYLRRHTVPNILYVKKNYGHNWHSLNTVSWSQTWGLRDYPQHEHEYVQQILSVIKLEYTAKKVTPFQYRKQDRYSSITVLDQRCWTVANTVIPGNIPYQDLVFSTEPAILTAS